MRFFAGDGELALLAARCPDIVCAYAMAGAQLTQGCQSTKHRKCGRWRSKVTGLNHTGTGLMLSMLALGEVEMEPFSDGTEDTHCFGGGWDLRPGLGFKELIHMSLQQSYWLLPANPEVMSLKEGGTLQLSLLSCPEAWAVHHHS